MLIDRAAVAAPASKAGATVNPDSAALWSLLGWVGASLVLVDLLDLALTWYPADFGNPEWEFGSVTTTLNGIPVLAMGLALVLGMAVANRRRWVVRTTAVAFGVAAMGVLLLAVLWATTVPIALQSIPADNPVLTGLKKAIAKTAGQGVIYPAIFLLIAVRSWRIGGRIESRST